MKLCPACGKKIGDEFDVCSPTCGENIKKLHSDPVFFAQKICRRTLYPKQVEFMRAIFENKLVAGLFSRQCVAADTLVALAGEEGSRPISEIVPGDRILSINSDGELKADIVANVWSTRPQQTFKITTDLGTVVATKEHKFLTDKGWYKLRGLKPGMRIASPSYITLSKRFERINDIVYSDVKQITPYKEQEVWDLETETFHNYITNSFVSHNSGKTETVSIAALYAATQLNETVGIFAPKLEQATRISFKRIKEFVKNSFWLSNYLEESRAAYMNFIGGGSITALSASDQSHIEGHTFHRLIIEEAQDISNYMFYDVITPMGSSVDAGIVKIGVPKGRNHFYDSIHKGEYYVVKSSWQNNPNKQYRDFVRKQKSQMPPDAFGSQYELKWNTKEGNYWQPEWLETAKELGKKYELELIDREMQGWTYGIGVDPAKKVDSTGIVVMAYLPSIDVYYPCYLVSFNGRDYTDQVGFIRSLVHKNFPSTKGRVHVDSQSTEAVVDMLKQSGPQKVNAKPIAFALKNKEVLYESFTTALIQGKIAFPMDRNKDMLKMLEQCYDLQVQYTAMGHKKIHHPPGKFDDFADALVLAFEAITKGGTPAVFGDAGFLSTEGEYQKNKDAQPDKLPDFYFI